MPLSEFLRMAREKFEFSQPRTDVVSRAENDLVELVWDNGLIVKQGQSNRATKSPVHNSNTSRVGKFGGFESVLNDMAPVVPSRELDLSQDDEIDPWLSYPIDDSLRQDYVSDLLPNISGVTGNGMSNQSSFLSSVDKRNSCNNQGSNVLRSGVSDIVSNTTCNNRDASMKMERQNVRPPSTFMNFSHFSRPANLVKGKPDGNLASGSSGVGRVEVNPEKSRVERFNSTPKEQGGSPPERTKNLVLEASIKNDNSRKGVPNEEKIVEPMVASSSVGSGNSGDRVSCEQTHNSKRKFRDIDESDYRSDDVDTESLDARKTNHVRGSKRGRAAEVHNLSERRRRDRINEKMRALQELIPNCNKADKASMLDEAIEYLKTLQLQVQMMSMGAGFCMPQMMFPQHMHPAQFPPMGVGMGFGMGMMDMNGVSSGYPSMFPVNPMHFPPPVSGIPNYQRIPVFQNSVPRAPFGPFTGAPPITPGMGMNSSRNGSSGEVANTSPIENAEASCSMNNKSNQATTEVLDQSQNNKQGTNVMGTTALTSATATTDNSKEPAGEYNKSPL